MKLWAAIPVITLALIITGCGGTQPSKEPGDQVILKMQSKMQEKKAENEKGKSEGNLNLEIKSNQGNGMLKAGFSALYDKTNADAAKADATLKVDGNLDSEDMKASVKGEVSLRFLTDTLYVMMKDVSISGKDPQIEAMVDGFVKSYGNKWIKIPMPDGKDVLTSMTDPLKTDESGLTEEQKKKIEELLKTVPLLKVTKDFGMDGKNFHLGVTLDKENIKKFLNENAVIVNQPLSAKDKQELDMFLKAAEVNGEIYVDGTTYELLQVKNTTFTLTPPADEADGKLSGTLDGTFSGMNTTFNANINFTGEESGSIKLSGNVKTDPSASVNVEVPAGAEEFNPLKAMGIDDGQMKQMQEMQKMQQDPEMMKQLQQMQSQYGQ